MRSLRLTGAVAALLAASLMGQQTGDANRDYLVNGNGSLQASPVATVVPTPASSMTNTYNTSDPNAPIVWGIAAQSVINWAPFFAANSIDIGPGGLQFLIDGTNPTNPLAPFAVTNGGGIYEVTLPTSLSQQGLAPYFAFLHLSPTSPDGFYISQTHQVTFLAANAPVCSPGAVNLALGDDQSTNQNLGFNFQFYGASYNTVNVWSNGSIEMGTGGTGGFNFSSAQFVASGSPEIAVVADDLNPSQGGTVSFFTDNLGRAEVCWDSVPEYFNTGSVTCQAVLMGAGQVDLNYGAVSTGFFTMGLSGGSASGLPGTPIDFTLSGGNAFGAPDTIYEQFSGSHDVEYRSFQIFLDPAGYPILQI